MPLGILTEEEFIQEKKSLCPDKETEQDDKQKESGLEKDEFDYIEKQVDIVNMKRAGRNGAKEVPNELRKLIAADHVESRQEALALAEAMNISRSSVSAYSNGATSTATYDEPKQSLTNHINNKKEQIAKKARNRLIGALEAITEKKLEEIKPLDAANVARAMSAIIKDMEPDNPEDKKERAPIFQIYAPQFRNEDAFELVYSKE